MVSPIVSLRSKSLGVGPNQWLRITESQDGEPRIIKLDSLWKNLEERELAEIAACCIDYLCSTGYVQANKNNLLWGFIVDCLDHERFVEAPQYTDCPF